MQRTLQRLWIQISTDKRRLAGLTLALTIGLLLWARIIIISNPPRRAVADDQLDPLATTGDTPREPAATSETDKEAVVVFLPTGLDRDPFRISRTHFPKPTSTEPTGGEVIELPANSADDQERIETRRTARLRSIAEQFTLEAAIDGGPAVIDGRAVRLGDTVTAAGEGEASFELVTIGSRSVVLECEGRRFELRMISGLNDS